MSILPPYIETAFSVVIFSLLRYTRLYKILITIQNHIHKILEDNTYDTFLSKY